MQNRLLLIMLTSIALIAEARLLLLLGESISPCLSKDTFTLILFSFVDDIKTTYKSTVLKTATGGARVILLRLGKLHLIPCLLSPGFVCQN